MCGICGFTQAELADVRTLKEMCDVMAHRGPDGEGQFIRDGVALGHRRLALVDLPGGTQPFIRQKNGTFAIVFNGEIYNHADLRAQLVRLGWTFRTRSDTETLLVAYMQWGQDCLHRLRGMFAFAIWDERRATLFCARDPFGIKPLYYTRQGTRFIFASEIKAILRHPAYRRQLNEEALEQYLCFQFSALPETFFKGIFKLPPAHWLRVDRQGAMEMQRYWRPEFVPDAHLGGEEAAARVDAAVRASVRLHGAADVPVGSLLSGGVDSSYLTSCLREDDAKARTFTVGFAECEAERNEIAQAGSAAVDLQVANAARIVSQEEYWGSMGRVLWHMDEPTGDPAAMALFFADELAATQVKAVLSGEGADELFGGYRIYQAALAAKRLRTVPRALLRRMANAAARRGMRGANFLRRAAQGPAGWYYTNAHQVAFCPHERDALLARPSGTSLPQQLAAPLYEHTAHLPHTMQMQYVDLHLWLVEDILQKTDRMSMAHSLEARVPYLDTEVFQVARMLPEHLRVTHQQTKVTLRRAAASALPVQTAGRAKLGFPVPLRRWLATDARQAQLRVLFDSPTARHFFDAAALRQLLDEHRGGQDRTRRIWMVCAFLVWHRIYFD